MAMVWYTIFVVVATIWGLGVLFGLILKDDLAVKVLGWVAKVEHQPIWWAPVGIGSLLLAVWGITLAMDVEIHINWVLLGRAGIFLLVVVVWALLFAWTKKRKASKSLEEGEEAK